MTNMADVTIRKMRKYNLRYNQMCLMAVHFISTFGRWVWSVIYGKRVLQKGRPMVLEVFARTSPIRLLLQR